MRFLILFVFFGLLISACGTSKKVVPQKTAFSPRYIELFHEGVRTKERRQYENAITIFEACISQNTNDDAAYFALSELYGYTNQKEKSIAALEKATTIDPKNEYYTQDLAIKYLATNNYKLASQTYQKLLKINPRNPDWLISYSECLLKSNKLKEAFETMELLQVAIGETPEIAIEKYKIKRYLQQEKEAEQILLIAIEKFPAENELLAQLIDYYFETKNDDAAVKLLFKLAKSDPKNGNVHLTLAQYYLERGDKLNTYQELKLAFQCPEISLQTKTKSITYFLDKQVKVDLQVIELVNQLTIDHPTEAKVFTLLGDIQSKNGNDTSALASYHKAIELDPSHYSIWEEVVIMEYEFRHYQQLYLDCKKAIELFPTKNKLYLLAGVSANQLKKYTEAIDLLEIGKEYVGKNVELKAEFYAQLGQAYFKNKQQVEANESYTKAIELAPTNQLNLNNYAYYLACEKIELEKAERMIKEVLTVSPNDSHFLDTYGWVLFQKGKYAIALTTFQEALKITQKEPLILEHIGDCQFKLGNSNEALIYWKLALEKGSKNAILPKKIDKKQYYEAVF
jgi:tetratricopeptide (TPR) repeat protein